METINLSVVLKNTVSVAEYVDGLPHPFKEKFLERKQAYRLNEEVIRKLKAHAKDKTIVVFSAEWCKDCTANVPVLALLSQKTRIKVRVFGGLKANPLNTKERWRVPPSPPEVTAFNVQEIPHIIIFDKNGKQLGSIIENPKPENMLEEEILDILQST